MEEKLPLKSRNPIRTWISPTALVAVLTTSIAVLGVGLALVALSHPPADLVGLLFFALLASVAELASVELHITSRHSSVSFSSIISTAGLPVFGPWGAVLITLTSAAAALLKMSYRERRRSSAGVFRLRRAGFNLGMFVSSTAAAGVTYLLAGGVLGQVNHPANFPALLAATSADNLLNLFLLIVVIALQTGRPALSIWKQDFGWSLPINILGGLVGGSALALAYHSLGILGGLAFFLPILSLGYSTRLYIDKTKGYVEQLETLNQDLEIANRDLAAANDGLETANVELLETLGAVIDAYDLFTRGHSLQVARYAGGLAETLGLPESDRAQIMKAALVHDIGKVGVTDAIIGKDGPLTPEEYNLVKRHPVIGADIIGRMTGLQDIVPLVKGHHERWDGQGYPAGLKGEEIPLGARVLALADALDVICSDRPYRPTPSFRQAREEVLRCSGTQFDPQIVQAFLALAEEKGSDYFKNSALTVEDAVSHQGRNPPGLRVRGFLKKSMVS